MKDWTLEQDTAIVCYCQNINKKTIVDSIRRGNHSLVSIKEETTACTGGSCKVKNPAGKCCSGDILELVRIYAEDGQSTSCSCCS